MNIETQRLLLRLKSQGILPVYGSGEYPIGYTVDRDNTNAKFGDDIMSLQQVIRADYIEFLRTDKIFLTEFDPIVTTLEQSETVYINSMERHIETDNEFRKQRMKNYANHGSE